MSLPPAQATKPSPGLSLALTGPWAPAIELPAILRLLIIAAALLLQPVRAAADFKTTVASADISGVDLTVASPLNSVPSIGVLPLKIEIQNYTASNRSWEMSIEVRNWSGAGNYKRREQFAVPSGERRQFEVLVPLLNQDRNFESSNTGLSVTASFSGYGLQSSYVTFPTVSSNWDKARLPYIGFSPALERSVPDIETQIEAQSLGALPELEKLYFNNSSLKGYQLAATKFSLEALPAKWPGYLGLRQVWLADSELPKLGAAQREALYGWIFQGGSLFVVTADPAEQPILKELLIEPLALASSTSAAADFGLGRVTLVRSPDRSLPASTFISLMQSAAAVPPLIRGETTTVSSTWGLTSGVGEVTANTGIIILIMAGYGLLVGPVNILVFARNARHRLFITTPLIAAAAALLIVLFILFSDGTGGQGNRLLAVLINPNSRLSLMIQEQASLAGLLVNREFTLADDSVILPIRYESAAADSSHRSYNNYYANSKTVEQNGNEYSGEWFENRAINAQVIGSVASTRSSVQLLSGGSTPPHVLSNIKTIMKDFFYRDQDGRVWFAANLQPGTETILQPETESRLDSWFSEKTGKGAAAISNFAGSIAKRRSYFYGWTDQAESMAQDTVSSIKWRSTAAIISGPLAKLQGVH